MTIDLFLLRHGKSDWRVNASDHQRPLKPRGERDARRIGIWLRQTRLPDHILCSSALRAWQTCNIACEAMGIAESQIQAVDDLYHGEPQTIVTLLRSVPKKYRCVMVVGHNPGLEEVLLHLLSVAPPSHIDGKTLPTGTLAHLQFQQPWAQIGSGLAVLKQLIRGKELASSA